MYPRGNSQRLRRAVPNARGSAAVLVAASMPASRHSRGFITGGSMGDQYDALGTAGLQCLGV